MRKSDIGTRQRRRYKATTDSKHASPIASRARTCVLVLGMHRSGTSSFARVLNLLGLPLGEPLLPPSDNNNEVGFWELAGLVAINEQILDMVETPWDSHEPLPEGWLDALPLALTDSAVALVERNFSASAAFVLKDPRVCRLWRFWLRVFERIGVHSVAVHVLRAPAEVAASLARRDGLSIERSAAAWIRYVLDAETMPSRRMLVTYDALLSDAHNTIDRMRTMLARHGVKTPRPPWEAIDAFLQATLRHHRELPPLGNELGALTERLYAQLVKITGSVGLSEDRLPAAQRKRLEEKLAALLPSIPRHEPVQVSRLLEKVGSAARERVLTQQHVLNLEQLIDSRKSELTAVMAARAAAEAAHLETANALEQFAREKALTDQHVGNLEQQIDSQKSELAAVAAARAAAESAHLETANALEQLAREKALTDQHVGNLEQQIDSQKSELTAVAAARAAAESAHLETANALEQFARERALTDQHVGNLEQQIDSQKSELAAVAAARAAAESAHLETANALKQFAREKALTDQHVRNLETAAIERDARIRQMGVRIQALSIQVDNDKGIIADLVGDSEKANVLIADLGARVASDAKELAAVAAARHAAESSLVAVRAALDELTHVKSLTDQHVRNLEAMLAASKNEVDALRNSWSWRLTLPLRAIATIGRVTLNWLGLRMPRIALVPGNELEATGGNRYRATGSDSWFTLAIPRHEAFGGWPRGWYAIALRGLESEEALSPKLYPDYGAGFSEQVAIPLPADVSIGARAYIRLRKRAVQLRLDPADHPLHFRLDVAELRRVPTIWAIAALARPLLVQAIRQPLRLRDKFRSLWRIWRTDGFEAVMLRIQRPIADRRNYAYWVECFDTADEARLDQFRRANERLEAHPRISVLVPVYNTPEAWLRRCIESVLEQTYPDWELCLADDASTLPHVARVIAEFAARDPRIKTVRRDRNGHISLASNSALALATGEYVALLDHDDELASWALYWVALTIAEQPDTVLLYSDEDKLDENGHRFDPYFKPDWNPELLYSQNYFSHLGVYRRDAVVAAGGFRAGFEGSQDWDLVLRVAAHCRSDQIRHIPRVLYHWRSVRGSTALRADEKSYAADAGLRAVNDAVERAGVHANIERTLEGYHRVRYVLPDPLPLVSIIIPTRNMLKLVETCIGSLLGQTHYERYEILLVDNQSDDPDALAYFRVLARKPNVRVIHYNAAFNFSAINNFGAAAANGSVLVLLNNDIEITHGDWLDELVRHTVRPQNGVVGAKLLYPDQTIQHAGIIVGFGGVAGHVGSREPRGYPGQMSRCRIAQNLTAVTAACLAVRKSVYEEAGGMDAESLPIVFNDVDFCLKVAALGYRNVWTPYVELIHHESASRGKEDTSEKQTQFVQQVQVMQRRWGEVLQKDPAYNPNLNLDLKLERRPFGLAYPPRIALDPDD